MQKFTSLRRFGAALAFLCCSSASWATITGTVFQDYNGNGLFDTAGSAGATASDRGIGGVTVTAYGSSNTVCGTTTTSIVPTAGSYTLTLSSTTGSCTGPTYRLEFTTLPAAYKPGARSTDSVDSGVLNNSASSTQFVADGSTNVNFAVNIPCDYCENNPTLITSRFVGSGVDNVTAALSFPFISGIPAPNGANGTVEFVPTTHGLAFNSQDIGSVWGSSFAKQKRTVFLAAFQKRHTAYAKIPITDTNGLNGSGRIYYAQKPASATGAATVTVPNLLVDLEALFPGSSKPAGNNHDPAAGWDNDVPAFGRVGRVGYGDVAVSQDETTLYTVSLQDKKIYSVPLSNPVSQVTLAASVSSVDILTLANVPTSATGCPNAASLIPGAINVNRYTGQIYFGLTCVAQGPGGVNDPSLLRSFVYRWDGVAAAATQVANFPLNYPRECLSGNSCAGTNDSANWLPWSDNQTDIRVGPVFGQSNRPQPWLMNIDFDEAGRMIVGFADRAGHQLGNSNGIASTGPVEGVSGGDTLRLVASTTTPGTWDAPLAAEFYVGDTYGASHQEITLGGLAYVPGTNQVVSGAFDPVDPFASNFRSGGVIWLDNTTGAKSRQYMIFGPDALASFGKAAGVGDIELLCDPAPIEIGNRVWRDLNGNGIQDPNEPPISGVTVQLIDTATGTVVGTTTTDANGEYYFNATNVADGDVASAGAQPGLKSNTNYTIRIPNATGAGQLAALAGTIPTVANSSGDGIAGSGLATNDSIADVRDSDGVRNGINLDIAYNTGAVGNNNHGLDFGFTPSLSIGNRVWYDTNNNGILDAGEAPISGVLVDLLNASGQKLYRTATGDITTVSAGNTAIAATTDANGFYRFDDLIPGTYSVRVTAANWTPGTGVLAGYANSSFTGSGATTGAGDPNGASALNDTDKGIDNATPVTGGIVSRPVTLGPGLQPTGEDVGATGAGQAGPGGDANDNRTVDFGFYRLSVGNLIWRDDGTGGGGANNGLRDGAEPGIDGVRVELLDSTNTVVAVTTTAGGGLYQFTQQTDGTGVPTGNPLAAGNYTVRVPGGQATLGGLQSSADPAGGATPLSTDSDDNGTGTNAATGATSTSPFALAAGTNAATGAVGANATGSTDQPRVDFGFVPPSFSIGNRVFLDPNNNGKQDAGETGITGATVNLRDNTGAQLYVTPGGVVTTTAAGNTAITAVTDASGYYRFDGLPASATGYIIGVVATSLPAGVSSSTGTLAGDQGDKGADTPVAGEYRSAAVPLGTGLQPTGETDLTATGAGAQGPSGDANTNSTIDFGFVAPTFSIGNRVFLDPNNNAKQDGTETGIASATLNLRDSTGAQLYRTPGGVVTTTAAGNTAITAATDASGYYRFDGLPASATGYIIGVVAPSLPAGVVSSTGTLAGDQGDKGADTPVAGEYRSAAVPLGTGLQPTGETDLTATGAGAQGPSGDANTNSTIDFGFVAPTFSIGNRVFLDPNNNAKQDGTETGIAGATVNLRDNTGAQLYVTPGGVVTTTTAGNTAITATTDASGYYRFDGLPASATGYIIGVVSTSLPAGVSSSTGTLAGDQGDKGADTPVAGEYRSAAVPLGTGLQPTGETDLTATGAGAQGPSGDANTNSTIDFGFVPATYSIGNRVWRDSNNDGLRAAAGEPGIDAVAMTLYRADAAGNPTGGPVATTTTAAGGYYRFDNLQAGDYVVIVDAANFATGAPLKTLASSTTTQANPNSDIDNDDNGIDAADPAASGIRSGKITVGPGTAEPVGETDLVAGANPQGPAPDNQANMTVDFGFYPLASLGDRVFLDTNANGIQDAGEGGVPGVTVKLLDSAGNPVIDPATGLAITTTTDGSGNYLFSNLPVGSYQVEIVPPAGYAVSPKDQGGNDATDSDIDLVTHRTPVVTLAPGENNLTLDAGLYFTAALGDRVWHDLNKNGLQDAGEPGVAGVTVNLLNAANVIVATTTTDGSGNYNFTGLTPGVPYVVEFKNLPAGYQFTTKGPGASTSDPADSDADVTTGRTDPITLVSGQNDPNWDAGIFGPIDLTLNKAVAPVAPATGSPYLTGDQLEYTLTVVNNGPATALAGYTVTDLLPIGLTSASIVSSTGFTPCAVAGSTLSCTGAANLPAGAANALTIKYRATISAAAGTVHNVAYVDKAATDPSAETNPLGPTPTGATNASATATNNDADANVVVGATTYSLGNRVWVDTNNNGIIDGTEAGRDGVTVELIDVATNTVIATTVTANGGYYRFDGLPAADYIVQIAASNFTASGALLGYTSSGPTETNPNSDIDSNDNGLNAPVGGAIRSGTVTLGPATSEPVGETDIASPSPAGEAPDGRSNLTVDFGFVPPASLGNLVFNDLNGNGLQDAGEPGVSGVTVTLLDGAGNPVPGVAPQITDASGNYLFTNLPPGTYIVAFTNLPTGTAFTPANQGGNDAIDSDVDPITGRTGPVTLIAGETNLTVDAGIRIQAGVTVGNFVWRDDNGNGIQDAGEPGIQGVTATIARVGGGTVTDVSGNPVATVTTTGATGNYLFSNLAPGQYTITFSTLPAGFTPTTTNAPGSTPANDSNGLFATTTVLLAGQSDLTLDLGLVPPVTATATVTGTVFSDPNRDGTKGAGEGGVPVGTTVTLVNPTTGVVVATTTTDVNGNYTFTNVPPGNYNVVVPTAPGGTSATTPTTVPVIATTGTTTTAPNIGFGPASGTATVTGTVFSDPNRDGTKGPGEGGVPVGTTVTLVDPTTGLVVATTTTDVNGNYAFTNVPPGNYNVVVPTAPGGTSATTPTTVPVIATTGTTTTAPNIGFGPATGTATITGTVFSDPNRDGTKGAGEGGVPVGTTVTLVNPTTGVVVATTTTDVNGNYTFTNVPPGNYNVVVPTAPGGTSATTPTTVPVIATTGTTTTAPNIGFGPTAGVGASIVGTVFRDPNRSGTRDIAETGAGQITVSLINSSGMVVATAITDANGNYTFLNVPTGNYTIVVSAPNGLAITTPQSTVTVPATGSVTAPAIGLVDALNGGVQIPTLSEWALILLAMLLGAIGVRQQQRVSTRKLRI